MKDSVKVFILLPAFNEEEGIEKLLERLVRITSTFLHSHKIIIVNDGSVDHTQEVIECFKKHLNIEIISFDRNKGIVNVFQSGFKKVISEGDDNAVCITMDSDNTQNPFIILDIINKMNDGYDIVIASRFAPGGKTVGAPTIRKLMSLGVAFILRNLAGVPGVKDYSTFYRGVRVRLLRQAWEKYQGNLVSGHGFSGMARLLIKLHPLTRKITEVPITLRYDLKEGGSGMSIFKTIKGYLILFSEILNEKRTMSR